MNRPWGWKRSCKNLVSGWWDATRSCIDSLKIYFSGCEQPSLPLALSSHRLSSVPAVWTGNSPFLLDSLDLRTFAAKFILICSDGPRVTFPTPLRRWVIGLIVFIREASAGVSRDSVPQLPARFFSELPTEPLQAVNSNSRYKLYEKVWLICFVGKMFESYVTSK